MEYSTDNWLEKNKDQLPVSSVHLIQGAEFDLLSRMQVKVRYEHIMSTLELIIYYAMEYHT